jgi:uncharacterized protein (DUF302 family)
LVPCPGYTPGEVTAVTYHISRKVDLDFDEAVVRVSEQLKQEGFGVLTEIDAQATLKERLALDFRPYRILGACNPEFAHRALEADEQIGVLLPCNVVVQQHVDGSVEVSAMDPALLGVVTGSPELKDVAGEARERIRRVIESL